MPSVSGDPALALNAPQMRTFCSKAAACLGLRICLAGAPGFEPGNGGIKIHCLTTWRRPSRRPDHSDFVGRALLRPHAASVRAAVGRARRGLCKFSEANL